MVSYEGKTGWVFAEYINVDGDIDRLAVFTGNGVQQSVSEKSSQSDFILCKDTWNSIGEFVVCKIPRAYCSYQPSASGSPTFCNDAPYPSNDFTLVVWEKDWSNLDGSCILVRGTVSLYDGKPQIEASSSLQVSVCP
jgi:hypothetical protein